MQDTWTIEQHQKSRDTIVSEWLPVLEMYPDPNLDTVLAMLVMSHEAVLEHGRARRDCPECGEPGFREDRGCPDCGHLYYREAAHG